MAFQQSYRIASGRLDQFDLHVRIAPRIPMQKRGLYTRDMLRRGADLENAAVAMSQLLSPLAQRAGVVQQTAAVGEQLLACTGQQQAAADAIEQLETELPLKVADLPGQRRLGDAQLQRRLRHRAEFGHGHESPGVPKVHAVLLMPKRY